GGRGGGGGEEGGAGGGESGDDERRPDLLVADLGMPAPIVLDAEPVHEHPGQIVERGEAAEEGEPRLGVDRREQALERLAEVRVAEVVEAGPAASGREEASGSERDEPPPHRGRPAGAAPPRAPTSVATPWSCQATSPGTPSETSRTRFT